MMGTSAGNDFADGIVGNLMNESTRIQACIDWLGPINFATMTPHAKQLRFNKSFDVTIESKCS